MVRVKRLRQKLSEALSRPAVTEKEGAGDFCFLACSGGKGAAGRRDCLLEQPDFQAWNRMTLMPPVTGHLVPKRSQRPTAPQPILAPVALLSKRAPQVSGHQTGEANGKEQEREEKHAS